MKISVSCVNERDTSEDMVDIIVYDGVAEQTAIEPTEWKQWPIENLAFI